MSEPDDPRTAACVSIVWLLLINKPVYPLYVWVLIGSDAATRSLGTLALVPLYAALLFLARRLPRAARIALPLVGLGDTLYATKLMGAQTGTELFFIACGLLAVVCFRASEAAIARALIIVFFLAFAVLHGRYGAPLQPFSAEEAATLFTLNLYGAASLAAFIALRFAPLA
jgi:hypothetical protein